MQITTSNDLAFATFADVIEAVLARPNVVCSRKQGPQTPAAIKCSSEESRDVPISKMGADPLSPEVGGDACQQACPEPDEANLLFQKNTGGT